MNSDGQDHKKPDHDPKSRDNRFKGDRFNDDSHKGNDHTGYSRDGYGQKGDSIKIGKRFAFIFWVLFLMLMFVFFSDQLAIQENPNQRPQSFVDGRDTVLVLKQNRKGHYAFLKTDAPAPAVQEMERLMRLHDDVMRVLTIKVDAHEEGPSVQMQKKDDRGERRERR